MSVQEQLLNTDLRDELALKDIVEEFVYKIASEFRAELSEEFARVGQIVSNQGNEILDVVCNGRHVATLIANH